MRETIFKLTAIIFGSFVSANISIGNATTNFVASIFNLINEVLRFSGKSLMSAIDSERLNHVEQTGEQVLELTELKLLIAANKTKDDALKNRVWTMKHTVLMNQIGSALYHQCGWEPARIHSYMRQVIESIPGVTYVAGDDYDEE